MKIKKITKLIEPQLTGDIEVEDTHTYQLENGVISHNSTILQTASGIHGEHAPFYIRNVTMGKDQEVPKLILSKNPAMVETSADNPENYIVSFPITAPPNSIFRKDLEGVKLLQYVQKVQNAWVEGGTNVELCTDPTLRHNVSNTITVNNWKEVARYVFDNKQDFCGISFLPYSGDKIYNQAPFTEVLSSEELVENYGEAAFFASGLIVDGLSAFTNLWRACNAVVYGTDEALQEGAHNHLLARDWVRRAKKFADNYFAGDVNKMIFCLKDVYILHKYQKIVKAYTPIDWTNELSRKEFVDIDTLGGVSCAGGACEINF